MELRDAIDEFEPVAQAFDALGIEYLLGGSVASSVHGFPRGTHDIDVEADIREEHVAELVKRLETRYIVTPEMIREAIRYRRPFNLIPFNSLAKIDVFVPQNRAFDREAARRRQSGIVLEDGTTFPYYVGSAEDTVLRKLEWYRAGGEVSDTKWNDTLSVLKAQCFDIDIDYLEKWAREIGVADLLERALDEAGLKDKETDEHSD